MGNLSNVIWSGISIFGQSGISFLTTIILARFLSPDDFGLIAIVTIFIALSQMMVDSEMGGALLKKKHVDKEDYSTLFYYNLTASIILYTVLFISAPYISEFYERPELTEIIRLISVAIIIHAFRVVQRIMIFRELKYKAYAIINTISGLISLGAAIWIAIKGFGYWALVWYQIIGAFTNVLFLQIYNRFIPSLSFSKSSFKYQFSFGISLLGSDIVKTVANNVTTNIIPIISTLQFTGYYSQTSRITNTGQSFLDGIMNQTIFPMLVKLDSINSVKSAYYKLLRIIILGLLVVTLPFLIFPNFIIRILLGAEWTNAAWILQVLSLSIIPASIQVVCRNIFKTMGATKMVLVLETAKSVIVIAALLISAFFSYIWVVWSIVISNILSCLIWMIFTRREFRIRIDSPVLDSTK